MKEGHLCGLVVLGKQLVESDCSNTPPADLLPRFLWLALCSLPVNFGSHSVEVEPPVRSQLPASARQCDPATSAVPATIPALGAQ